ncbi:MAG: hypothetical protein EHM77_05790 [Planctomycetaceae bacterium]|nr:MAG: hypothetical protein EHM77_05790 [Planctomycetaceae bacterium]
MSGLPRHRAMVLLEECTGDHVWSVAHCESRGVPAAWIGELADAHESGFRHDSQTLYTDAGVTNQYQGVRDFDLAIRLGRSLGIDVERILASHWGRAAVVLAIKEAVSDE